MAQYLENMHILYRITPQHQNDSVPIMHFASCGSSRKEQFQEYRSLQLQKNSKQKSTPNMQNVPPVGKLILTKKLFLKKQKEVVQFVKSKMWKFHMCFSQMTIIHCTVFMKWANRSAFAKIAGLSKPKEI